jgi:hypothetical protein
MEAAIETSVLDSGYNGADRITYWRRAAAPATASPPDPGGDSRKEALRMSPNSPRRLAATALVLSVIVSACGSSSGTPSTTATAATAAPSTAATAAATTAAPTATVHTAVASPAATGAAASCPTAATVDAALGITVNKAGGGGTQLPAGAKAIACEYSGTGLNVIIEVIANVDPSTITLFSSKFPVAYTSVSGVGDQARSFSQSLGGGTDNEGVVATKGSTLVAITATATPASLAQIEALVNQLL